MPPTVRIFSIVAFWILDESISKLFANPESISILERNPESAVNCFMWPLSITAESEEKDLTFAESASR